MSSIALRLSRFWTSSLVVLLVTPSSVVLVRIRPQQWANTPALFDNIVGLQTNSQTVTRFAGRIDADAQQKFLVTIEESKQLPEDWCFSPDALDDLKKLRRGEKPGTNPKTHFLDPLSRAGCASRADVKISSRVEFRWRRTVHGREIEYQSIGPNAGRHDRLEHAFCRGEVIFTPICTWRLSGCGSLAWPKSGFQILGGSHLPAGRR